MAKCQTLSKLFLDRNFYDIPWEDRRVVKVSRMELNSYCYTMPCLLNHVCFSMTHHFPVTQSCSSNMSGTSDIFVFTPLPLSVGSRNLVFTLLRFYSDIGNCECPRFTIFKYSLLPTSTFDVLSTWKNTKITANIHSTSSDNF